MSGLAPSVSEGPRAGEGGVYAALFVLVAGLAALPFLLVDIPPIHDLPHHLEQARLHAAIGDTDTSAYRVDWLAPQNLIYVALVPLWNVLDPFAAGKAFTYLLLVATIAAVFNLARRRGRGPECAAMASLLAFNSSFYAGFFAFQLGGVLFLIWLGLNAPSRLASWIVHAVLLFATAWAHAFWFALIGLVMVARLAIIGRNRADWIALAAAGPGAAWLLPNLLGVMRARNDAAFPMGVVWESVAGRLTPLSVIDGLLGGVRGGVEVIVVIALAAWVAAGLAARRTDAGATVDRPLLVAGGIVLLAWFLSPDLIAMTLGASRRWLPYAGMLLVLAVPTPRAPPRVLRTAVAGLTVALLLVTAQAWSFYDRAELSGFRESIQALPENASLLGLGLLESQVLKGAVFFQTHAWAQILRGARPDLSFTDLGAGLVLSTERRTSPFAYPMSLRPFDVRPEDILHFEYAVVAAPQGVHIDLAGHPRLAPLTDGLPWRLYGVLPASADGAMR